ncbi:CD177 antigen [Myotis brandtii]|uniref:CD177 antigen n=1 Tax=Myotis brandtii TaxID=109478 RepID=S7PTS4_MYOBR|nr:CD177 antigen [Myotis brandtii]
MTCSVGHRHCYNGVLHLRGVGIFTDLKVQGCMSQASCNLLNETREIGALSVSEKCNSDGPLVFLALIKGCTQKEDHEARITQHRKGPGLSVISYTRVCRHKNCNDLTSTDPVWTLPTSAVPGSVWCPVCFSEEGFESATEMTCPVEHTHCYNGTLQLRGVGIRTDLKVQGCMSQASCNLLNETREIGALSVSEKCDSDGVQALTCQSGTLTIWRKTSELPLEWKTGEEFCMDGWGCQDSLMLIENVFLALSKGCTQKEDHEVRVTQHRKGPGLSVVSYTRVCRHKNLCNDLSSTLPVWTLPTSAVPGSVWCPVCFTEDGCKSSTELICPVKHTHCYNGTLDLRGIGILGDLKVQGCMSQAACNLLNETREIGALSVSEKCASDVFLALSKGCTQKEDHEVRVTQHRKGPGLSVVSYTRVCRHKNLCNDLSSTLPVWTLPTSAAPLTCQKGVMLQMKENLAQNPQPWNTFSTVTCDLKEVCQETLLLIDVGPTSLIAGIKGCSKTEKQNSTTISIHSAPPGVLVASYANFCSSDGCNRATSSSVLLNSLPRPAAPAPVPGGLQCPACVQFGGSCSNTVNVKCPPGTTHCYNGYLNLKGDGPPAIVNIQGCVAQPSSSLLNHTKNIGQFIASEGPENEEKEDKIRQSGAVPVCCLAWVVGLGISLALWCGITSH